MSPEHNLQTTPTDDIPSMVSETLKKHDKWLRTTPCSSKEIVDNLFPTEGRSPESERDLILTITAQMWDNGFTPSSRGRARSRWYWLEKVFSIKSNEPLASAVGIQPDQAPRANVGVQITEAEGSFLAVKAPNPEHRLGQPLSLRKQKKSWVTASGTLQSRLNMADFYLQGFDHVTAAIFDQPVMTMAKAVCNLRYYFRLNGKQTAVRMLAHFNPKARYRWSEEGILLAWELVEGFTPSLGLSDKDAIAKHHLADLQEDVKYLLADTLQGGRVSVEILYARFKEWNPDVETNEIAFGRVVTSLTGITSKSSKGKRYYSGFHLPSASKEAAATQVVPIRRQMVKAAEESPQPINAA